MIENTLDQIGFKVLPVGLGGIPIQRLDLEESDRLLATALDLGVNFFDSARAYTDSEMKMGRVLAKKRKQVCIASKSMAREGRALAADLELSLQDLATDYLDIYQCHNVSSEADLQAILAPGGALETLEKKRQAGTIRFIGITGHKPWLLLKALKIFPFATVQVPINYLETLALAELVPAARRAGIGVIAMKPMAGGAIQERSLNLRFIFAAGADLAIPGVDSPIQIRENLACLEELRPLDSEEIARLEREKSLLGTSFCRRCEYCQPCPAGLPIAFLHVLRAYYFRYNLQDWVLERLKSLPKSYADCLACGACREKCPYDLDTPAIFRETREKIAADLPGRI